MQHACLYISYNHMQLKTGYYTLGEEIGDERSLPELSHESQAVHKLPAAGSAIPFHLYSTNPQSPQVGESCQSFPEFSSLRLEQPSVAG